MAGYKNIIVGVDLSAHSKKLVREALALSKNWKANITLAYIVNIGPGTEVNYPTMVNLASLDIEALTKQVKSYYHVGHNKKVGILVKAGTPVEELGRLAKKRKNSLIMVGHSDRNLLSRLFSESTTRRLTSATRLPVLIH